MMPFARFTAAALLLASTAANADTLTAVAAPTGPNIAGVALLGINNAGWTTGTVRYTDGTGDGFLRAPDGTYTIFDNGGYLDQGRAIGNTNRIVGYSSDAMGNILGDWSRDPVTGVITTLTNPSTGVPLMGGIAQGINDAGAIVGNYNVTVPGFGAPRSHGFILAGSSLTDISYPGAPGIRIAARGINNAGVVVGFAGGTGEAFVRQTDGSMSFISRPEAANFTILAAINNSGIAIGGYDDADGNGHAFTYNTLTHTYSDIFVPGATSVQTFALNDLGQYVVSSDVGSFIFTPGGPSAPDGSAVFLPVAGKGDPVGTSSFDFNVKPGQTYYIDPSFARGFEYLSGDNVDFASVTLPVGVAPGDSYVLALWNGTAYKYAGRVAAGSAHNFAAPVDRFRIYGIPNGVVGEGDHFITGLTFDGTGQFNGQQISLVPEPAAWALMIGGFGLVGGAMRRRKDRLAAA